MEEFRKSRKQSYKAKMEADRVVVAYIFGRSDPEAVYSWYRVEALISSNKLCERKHISPVATLFLDRGAGLSGDFTVVDNGEKEYIYYTGGFSFDSRAGYYRGPRYACMDLLKHRSGSDWETVSSRRIPRTSPLLAAFGEGRKKKICLVGGDDDLPKGSTDDKYKGDWSCCGECFDLDTNTWSYLDSPMDLFRNYDSTIATLAVDKDEIAFYSLPLGSMLFYNLPDNKPFQTRSENFNFWKCHSPPQGLDNHPDLRILFHAINDTRAAFCNDTLYWFAYDLYLVGYDTKSQKWLLSQPLAPLLHPLMPPPSPELACRNTLLALPNGKLVVIVHEDNPQHFTMACLSVVRAEQHSLHVSVECIQPFSIDDDSFYLFHGQAMLKNHGSATMHGRVRSAMET